jgi:hypothetical protein
MKLCGFDVGLDHPLFLIAGERWSAEQGPLWGCDRGGAQLGPAETRLV